VGRAGGVEVIGSSPNPHRSGFQPTAEPTGFQPVVVQYKIIIFLNNQIIIKQEKFILVRRLDGGLPNSYDPLLKQPPSLGLVAVSGRWPPWFE
jgi:hypothetical protein